MIECSAVEIYNNDIFDLSDTIPKLPQVRIKLDTIGGVLKGKGRPKHFRAYSGKEMMRLFIKMNKNRSVSSTAANNTSSRSHAIFMVKLTSK